MTFRARLTLFFVGIVAAPLVVGMLVAASSARTQALHDADGRLQVAAVTSTGSLRLQHVRLARIVTPPFALSAYDAASPEELDRLRRSGRLDYLLVLKGGNVAGASLDLPDGIEADGQAIAGGALRAVTAERTVVIGGAGARVVGGRLWSVRVPGELRVRSALVIGGRPVGDGIGTFSTSATPVSQGDRRVVCICPGGASGLLLVTSAHSDGLGRWFRWPRVAFVILALALLVGVAYLLARVLTRPLARLAEEAAAVARGEPDVQPAVDEAAGSDLYQVATTLRTVSQALTGSRGELERTRGRLAAAERLTLIDPLTGVWNRRYLERALREHVKRHDRFHSPFGLLVVDIDRFKRINDQHGHAVGDAVLTEVAHTIDGSIRADIDVLTRFGGEEFVVVLPETDGPGSFVAAEKIRELVADSEFESEGKPIRVTVSIGVAACPGDAVDGDRLLAAADAALYQAKSAGRNRTVAASPAPAQPHS